MSVLLASASMVMIVRTDNTLLDDAFEGYAEFGGSPVLLDVFQSDDPIYGLGGYYTPWWPRAAPNGCLGDGGLGDVPISTRWQIPYPTSGSNGRLGFVGTTRDAYGSPLANCTVRCYLTATGELVSTVVSDAKGAFTITTPFGGGHFLTTHATGVAGATVDTLTAS